MGFVVHSCNKTRTSHLLPCSTESTHTLRALFDAQKYRQDEVGGEIKYIDLGEGEGGRKGSKEIR